MNQDRELDWEPTIENDGEDFEFTLLEPGDYDFEVIDFDKTRSSKGTKMVVATLRVTDGKATTTIKENLVLLESCEWKLSQFFRALGLKKRGEKLKVKWNDAKGKTGRCRVKKDTFTGRDGKEKETNRVDRFYDYEDSDFEW